MTKNPVTKRWWTIPEFCEAIDVSLATGYRILKAGRIPKYKLGPNTTRLKDEDVIEYIESTRVDNSESASAAA